MKSSICEFKTGDRCFFAGTGYIIEKRFQLVSLDADVGEERFGRIRFSQLGIYSRVKISVVIETAVGNGESERQKVI